MVGSERMVFLEGPTALLGMGYGTPASVDEVATYLVHVRAGRPTPPELVEEVQERYRSIGGRSPFAEISQRQVSILTTQLQRQGLAVRGYTAFLHSRPSIPSTVAEILSTGIRSIVAVPLTPYRSQASTGQYFDALQKSLPSDFPHSSVIKVEGWGDEPLFLDVLTERVHDGLRRSAVRGVPNPCVIFTAHSIPRSFLEAGDPYDREIRTTWQRIRSRFPHVRTLLCYQSMGRAEGPWLGPDLTTTLSQVATEGERGVLIAPIGFISDHLETLYDLDIVARAQATRLGLHFERTASLNDEPRFIEAMAHIVSDCLAHSLLSLR